MISNLISGISVIILAKSKTKSGNALQNTGPEQKMPHVQISDLPMVNIRDGHELPVSGFPVPSGGGRGGKPGFPWNSCASEEQTIIHRQTSL